MIAVALLVVVVVFLVAYSSSRHSSSADGIDVGAPEDVRSAGLQRWVDAGLISDDQARAISVFEQALLESRPKPRVSPVVEALSYVGGVLLTVGAGMLVGQFWDELGAGGHVAVLATTAVVTGVVGTVVGESDPVTWRLRGFLWALSAGAAAAVAGLVVFEVLNQTGEPVALAAAATGALGSAGYWMLRNRPLQHAITFMGLAVSVGVAIAWAGGQGALIGLALWLVGGAWAFLAWQRRIPPPVVGFPLGVALTLVACGVVGSQVEWLAPLIGLATATAWVAVGVGVGAPVVLAPGVLGIFVFLPWTLGYFFGEALGGPAIAMLSGALLLCVVFVLVRPSRHTGVGRGRTWRGQPRPIPHG